MQLLSPRSWGTKTTKYAGFSGWDEKQQTSNEHDEYERLDGLLGNRENHKDNKEREKVHKKKVNRGKPKKFKEIELCVVSANAAQLKSKLSSFKSILKQSNAGIFTIQESHYPTKGKVQIENFEIFEAIRKKAKGGTMIGVHKALKPCLIQEYSNEFELIVVEIKVSKKEIRIISGYGPQESWPEGERMPFFLALEQEIIKAEIEGKSILIELDANSKLGPDLIPGDMHEQSENGKVLADIIKRHGLTLGNSSTKCEGLVTRKRVTKSNIEESVIDFVIFSDDLNDAIESITIDDKRECVLTNIRKTRTGVKTTESDHNTIITKFKFHWNKKVKETRAEMFNLKNKTCQEAFKEATTKAINNNYLSSVFEEEGDVDTVTEKFMKRLNKIINKCFRKVRIKDKIDESKDDVFTKWRELRKKNDIKSKQELEDLENQLSEEYSNEYFEKIEQNIGNIDSEDGGMVPERLWKLKKTIFPRTREPLTAMKDPKTGNMLTTKEKISEAAVNVFTDRLENAPMKKHLEHIKDAKEKLCEKIMKVASKNRTPPWNMKDLDVVLKHLKKQKSRDPYGLANDIFRLEVAGDDLKEAILRLMNKIKDEQAYPKCLELCNISSLWKKKGNRNDFNCYRGIFRVTIFRSILDRLIYNDEISNIDSNLTDSNVGGRKQRNIRDNIFVMNAIRNSISKEHDEAIDFQIYDIEKCFDKLWLHEVINSLYEAGLRNDKLPLLFLENENAQVAVKSNGELSTRKSIKQIIMQGSVWGSICCVVLMDKLGKIAYNNPEMLFYYKNLVGTPPLQMVDDVMAIQRCSNKSLMINKVINTFMDLEKLSLSKAKCHNIHIGNQLIQCPKLKVNGAQMHNSEAEIYLGDILEKNTKKRTNIEKRKSRGYGIVNDILAIVNGVPLSHWKIKAGLLLRQAMLINGILFNSEAWHNVTTKDIMALEKVDEALLRGLLRAHAKTPLEALYLETNSIPIRYILKSRRIMYLHNILQKENTELVKRIYEAQKNDTTPGDFCEIVTEDCNDIELNMTENDISKHTKQRFKIVVKSKVRNAAFKYLKENQEKHSKMQNLKYPTLKMQDYLFSPIFDNESRDLLVRLRTRTVSGIKSDFKGLYTDTACPLMCGQEDTIPHLLSCSVLRSCHKSTDISISDCKHEDIYSEDVTKQRSITEIYKQLLHTRNEILSQPVDETGPMHSSRNIALQSNALLLLVGN